MRPNERSMDLPEMAKRFFVLTEEVIGQYEAQRIVVKPHAIAAQIRALIIIADEMNTRIERLESLNKAE